jgi:septum formation protein
MEIPSFIYLASQSPRRAQLLDQLGVSHRPLLAGLEEDAESLEIALQNEAPVDYVDRVTINKMTAAVQRMRQRTEANPSDYPPAPILCADTTVALGHDILGKPADANEARAMLRRLSGQTHEVFTSVALAWNHATHQKTQKSTVRFRALSPEEIEAYIASGEPFGKAGAYAIQSQAAAWIAHITGSHSGIMGLPLFETDALLRLVR